MTIYWLLFAFAAAMALAYPVRSEVQAHGPAQGLAFLVFLLAYFMIAMLRDEIGGDWVNYEEILKDMSQEGLADAVLRTDPLFGLLMWVSLQLGTGIYLVNGITALVLGYGTIRTAMLAREPWLAILIAVPYLLIVVGMGVVRQGAAIGMILLAIVALVDGRVHKTIVCLAVAAAFHSTASIVFPLFGYALARRNKLVALILLAIGAIAFILILAPRLESYQVGYIDAEFDSRGALVRVLMSFIPSALLLVRWRRFNAPERIRVVWLGIALANCLALAAFVFSPSSTAVDRMALYFSIIQIAVFGEIGAISGMSQRSMFLVRIMVIVIAAAVQAVWLVFAANAEYWVPYKSVLQNL